MNMLLLTQLAKSRTAWASTIMFLASNLDLVKEAINPIIPVKYQPLVNLGILFAILYFKSHPKTFGPDAPEEK